MTSRGLQVEIFAKLDENELFSSIWKRESCKFLFQHQKYLEFLHSKQHKNSFISQINNNFSPNKDKICFRFVSLQLIVFYRVARETRNKLEFKKFVARVCHVIYGTQLLYYSPLIVESEINKILAFSIFIAFTYLWNRFYLIKCSRTKFPPGIKCNQTWIEGVNY